MRDQWQEVGGNHEALVERARALSLYLEPDRYAKLTPDQRARLRHAAAQVLGLCANKVEFSYTREFKYGRTDE